MQRAAAHVERLDAVRRRGADGRVVAVADGEVVLDDAAERREREQMRDHRRAVGFADVEDEAVAADADRERVGPAVMVERTKAVVLDQIVDRDRALVLDVAVRAADRRSRRASPPRGGPLSSWSAPRAISG